jgi:hypothetical protein
VIRAFLLVVCATGSLCSFVAARACAGEEKPQPELRTVETYVPFDEFLKIVGSNKDATMMSLEDYRALVGLAIARGAIAKEPSLPPITSALTEAVYTGVAQAAAVRFDVAFKVVLTGPEWVRCDLGPVLPSLGRITLDNEPAWVVTDKGRAYLLAKGAGTHAGTLSFTLAPQKEEDVQKIAGPLFNAATAVMKLEIGRAHV